MSDRHQMVSFWTCPNCFAVMRKMGWSDALVTSDDGWRWTDPAKSSRPMHACMDDTEHWGVIRTQAQLDSELRQQAVLAKDCLANLIDIWNAMFPDEPDGWEYRGQIVRSAISHIKQAKHTENLIFTTPGLADALLRDAGYDPKEVGARMAARVKEISERAKKKDQS